MLPPCRLRRANQSRLSPQQPPPRQRPSPLPRPHPHAAPSRRPSARRRQSRSHRTTHRAMHQQLTSNMRRFSPPLPTANCIVLPHLGHRAAYCVASRLRNTFWYAPAHLNHTIRNGRPVASRPSADSPGLPRRKASSPATMSSGTRNGECSFTRNQSAAQALTDYTRLRTFFVPRETSEGAGVCPQLSLPSPQIPPKFRTLRSQHLKQQRSCVMLVPTIFPGLLAVPRHRS